MVVSVAGKKGRVMERRLMKDFQIGLVEGIVSDAITSNKEPKDVFSKIAQAIGKRSSSKGKDWNAMVRKSTMTRDPIGSTAEFQIRQSRQSLRRQIIDSQGKPDPDQLVAYNPMLSTVSPATRVAYAKFKISKIKQEFEDREAAGGASENTSQKGEDDVFQDGPASVKKVTEVKQSSSIVRPRPRASLSSVASASSASNGPKDPPKPPLVNQPTISMTAPDAPSKKEFRPRTPIPEDPREGMSTPDPGRPKSVDSAQGSKSDTPSTSVKSTASKVDDKKEVTKEVKVEEKKEEKKDVPKEALKPTTAEPPRRSPGPPKPGGKSKVTGEVIQGWL